MGINNLNYSIYSLFIMGISIHLVDSYLKPYLKAKILAYQLNKIIERDYSTKFINNIDIDKLKTFIPENFKHTDIQTIIFKSNNKNVHITSRTCYEKVGVSFESIPDKKSLLNRFFYYYSRKQALPEV
jgi:hypothetical protein